MNLEVRLEGLVTTAELAARPDFPLGSAIVSPSARTVTGPGGKVDVEPRVMQLLVVLADAEGAVVTRATLFRRCWGSPAVSDDSLNRAVRSLRRLADEVADGSFVVETIPRTGYRIATADTAGAPGDDTGAGLSRRRLLYGGLAASAVGLGALGIGWMSRDRTDPRVTALVERSEIALRTGAPDAEQQAVRLLEAATRSDPESALAWGRLALARYYLVEHSPPDRTAAMTAAIQDAARRARAIEPRQVDAVAAIELLPPYYGDWIGAEQRMAKVLAIEPNHLPTLDVLTFMRHGLGRSRESSLERLRIAALDPLNVGQQFKLIYSHWILGDVAAADRAADRAVQLWPKHAAVWFGRLWTLAFTGRAERALAHINDAEVRPPLPPPAVETLRRAMIALASRRPADVAAARGAVMAGLAAGPIQAINAIMILTALGDVDGAFDVAYAYLLERGPVTANVRWRPGQVSVSNQRRRKLNMMFVPVTAPMRADPRFLPLMREIGVVDYWQKMRVVPDFLARRGSATP